LDGANRSAVARPVTVLWQLEQRLEALSSVGQGRCVGTHLGCAGRRSRFRIGHHRWNNHPSAPTCGRRKRGIQENAIGRSRGGWSTKIHIAVDALGNVLRLLYTAGQAHESKQAEALIAGLTAENLIGDKAFDSDRFRAHLARRNMTAVIPSNANRAGALPYDRHLYKERHLVELFINKIKHFRRVATRYDKTIASYASFVAVAGFMLWMR
jgi:transposase